jgi:hypothetical protein
MSEPIISRDETSVVLVGSFNPAIFHAAWLARHGLVQDSEAEHAQIEVISPDVAIFNLNWVRLEVIHERFVARTNDETRFDPLRDLVVGTFQLLEHTPVSQLGLNRELWFEMPSEEPWHQIGDTLAPKEIWREDLKNPGMKRLTIQAERSDDYPGYINITVQPTQPKVVSFAINDHYELGEANGRRAGQIIAARWDKSIAASKQLALSILHKTIGAR